MGGRRRERLAGAFGVFGGALAARGEGLWEVAWASNFGGGGWTLWRVGWWFGAGGGVGRWSAG